MPDDAYAPLGTDPAAAGPSPFTSPSVQVEPTPTNPEAMASTAQRFLDQHQAAIDARTKEVDNLFSKQQLTVDNMSKILDDTAASLKKQRDPANRSNLALMALGAGMMTSKGNFGTQIGAGIQNMIPAIEHDRADDQDFQFKMAQLAMRRAGIENAPLEQKLQYMRALQTGDLAAQRSIETMLIRAQGQTGKQDTQNEQNLQRANNYAMQRALDQVDKLGKDYFGSPEERDTELVKRYQMIARSMKVPEDRIAEFAKTMGGGAGTTPGPGGSTTSPYGKPKNFYDAPTSPQAQKELMESGMPKPPPGYVYDKIGPNKRLDQYNKETTAFDKESKDWDATSTNQADLSQKLNQMEDILNRNPHLTGRLPGGLPNSLIPNTSDDATKFLALTRGVQLHNVPKGQGAISDNERKLFESASPNMDMPTQANKDMINIAREVINRDREKREFLNEYFGKLGTARGGINAWERYINSPEGQAFVKTPDGRVTANTNRMDYHDFFRKENGIGVQAKARGGQFKRGGQFAKGGPIVLGAEWDN